MATTWHSSSSTGNDTTGLGTALLPFATIGKSASLALAGDSIVGLVGDTFTESVTITVGLALFGAYGGAGTATIVSTSATAIAVKFTIPPTLWTNWNVQGTGATYTGTQQPAGEILTSGTTVYTGVTISGCNFSNTGGGGLIISHGTADAGMITGLRINNNTFNNIGTVALALLSDGAPTNQNYSDVIINNNTISNILGSTAASGQGYGWAIEINGATNSVGPVLVHDNIMHDLGAGVSTSLIQGGTAFQCEGCTGLQLYNNIAYNLFITQNTAGNDGGTAFDIDVNNTDCIAYNNYGWNCDGPLLSCYSNGGTFTGNVFHHNVGVNVARNTPYGGIIISGTSPYVFYANTIICSGSKSCVVFATGGITPTCEMLNNAFVAPAGVPTVLIAASVVITSMTMDGNYHQSGDGLFSCTNSTGTNFTTLATWHTNTGFEVSGVAAGHCYFTQPQPPPTTLAGAAAAFAPALSSSPLLDAGANLLGTYGITPAADFAGNPWAQNSIGALYLAGSPTAYVAAVLADNPMSGLRLAEPSGTAFYDSVGFSEAGTWTAATLGSAVLVPGDGSPSSTSFDGASTFGAGVMSPHTYALSGVTFECWFTLTNLSLTNQILSLFNTSNTTTIASLSCPSGVFNFYVRDASNNATQGHLAGFTPVINTPYHFVFTAGGTTLQTLAAYINGHPQTVTYDAQNTVTTMGNGEWYLGNQHGFSRFFGGLLSNAWMYPSVLSSGRVLAHYTAGIGTGTAVIGGAPLLMPGA